MKNERFETVEDLINTDRFCEWVYHQKHEVFWQQWQVNNTHRQAMIQEAKEFLNQLSFQQKEIPEKEIAANLSKVWTTLETNKSKQPKVITQRTFPKKIFQIAATVLLLLVAGWSISHYFSTSTLTYATNYGETEVIQLPDNSTVVLQANSTLKVPKNWTKASSREVWLAGEAYFNVVKKQVSQPIKFIVSTEDFSVEVIGTQFDVLHRENNKRVILQEGAIKLRGKDNQEMALIPNEMVVFSKAENKFQKTKVAASTYTAWTQQKLILQNTPLSEIARMLEDNYGYQIDFGPSVNQTQARSSLGEINIKNLDNFITVIEASYEMKLTIKNKLIRIH